MGIVFQLSTSKSHKIDDRGFAFGSGGNNTLLGFNVIGTAVAWVMAAATLLENADGSNMLVTALHGNTVVKMFQKLLKPLDRIMGGKFEKGQRTEQTGVIDDTFVDKGGMDSNATFASEAPTNETHRRPQGGQEHHV